MSFLKKALLTAAVAAVGLAGTVAVPAPVTAATAGTMDFVGLMTTPPLGSAGIAPPVSGGITFSTTIACADASAGTVSADAGAWCQVSGSGYLGANAAGVGGYCEASAGTISGALQVSDGSYYYGYTVGFEIVNDQFTATGSYYKSTTGERGVIAIAAQIVPANPVTDPSGGSCFTGTRTNHTVAGAITLNGI